MANTNLNELGFEVHSPAQAVRKGKVIALYGLPGSGKTFLASTVARGGKTGLIDFDQGSTSVAPDVVENIVVFGVKDMQALENIDKLLEYLIAKKVYAVIIDTFSNFGVLYEMYYKDKHKKTETTWSDWRVIGEHFINTIIRLRFAGVNVILTFWANKTEQEGKPTSYSIDLHTRAKDYVISMCDMVGFIWYNGKQRTLYTANNFPLGILESAKTRYQHYGIPAKITDKEELYDMHKIIELINKNSDKNQTNKN